MNTNNIEPDKNLTKLLREAEIKAPKGLSNKIMQRIFAEQRNTMPVKKIFVRKDFPWLNILLGLGMGLLILLGINLAFGSNFNVNIPQIKTLDQDLFQYILPVISVIGIYFLYEQLDKYLTMKKMN